MENVIEKFYNCNITDKIFTYEEYLKFSGDFVNNTDPEKLDETGKRNYEFSKINLHRSLRIQKTFKPNPKLVEKIKKIDTTQIWLTITEDWCGDSAQNLPYFVKYIEFNPKIKFYIILRDKNLNAIDEYFTEGNPRSIPKIVGFDEKCNQLFVWGPRPKFAQDLVQQLRSEGYSKEEFNMELHRWYGKNKGKELEKELFELLDF